MALPIASSSARILIGKQSAQIGGGGGGARATDIWQPNWTAGNMTGETTTNTQEVLDGVVFSSPFIYTAHITGSGTITVLGDPETLARFLAWTFGNDTVTGSAAPYTHTINTEYNGSGIWLTVWTSVGDDSLQVNRVFEDCKINRVNVGMTAGDQICSVELGLSCTAPNINIEELPTTGVKKADVTRTFQFADGKGNWQVSDLNGGAPLSGGINQFSVTVERGQNGWQGDDIYDYALIAGRGQVSVGATLLVDQDSVPLLYNIWYDDPTPADGTPPTRNVFYDGFAAELTKGSGAELGSFAVDVPKLQYRTTTSIDPSLTADAIEMPIDGRALKQGSSPMATFVIKTADATAY